MVLVDTNDLVIGPAICKNCKRHVRGVMIPDQLCVNCYIEELRRQQSELSNIVKKRT